MEIPNQPTGCHTCELIAQRDAGKAPPWDAILRTEYWDVVHAYNTSLPGWLVLVVRRHITAVAEMTEAEAAELGSLLRRVSLALQKVTGCEKTYVIQFAEQAEHPHVHFHVIPRMADLPEAVRSTRIFTLLGVPPSDRVPEETMNEIAQRIRRELDAQL
jgi:diadenosine tetraphosphate (Ap4A) HIT family hydrolase